MSSIRTTIVPNPIAGSETYVQVIGRTDYGNGSYNEVASVMQKSEYELLRQISQNFGAHIPVMPDNPNADASNVVTATQLALLKAINHGVRLDTITPGSFAYEAASRVASDFQLVPHYALVDRLIVAFTEKFPSPTRTWTDVTAAPNVTPLKSM